MEITAIVAIFFGWLIFSLIRNSMNKETAPDLSTDPMLEILKKLPEADEIELSLSIVAEYGKIIEKESKYFIAPEKSLKRSKELILQSLVNVIRTVVTNSGRELIQNKYPEDQEHMLSEEFLGSLYYGISHLPNFRSKEDHMICRKIIDTMKDEKDTAEKRKSLEVWQKHGDRYNEILKEVEGESEALTNWIKDWLSGK